MRMGRPGRAHYRLVTRLSITAIQLRVNSCSPSMILALVLAVTVAPAAAQECVWPQLVSQSTVAGATDAPAGDPAEQPFEITTEGAEVSREGDAELRGGVVVRQGGRELRAESVSYTAESQRFVVTGAVEYLAPELRVKADGGAWSTGGGGSFTGTEFELPTRPARGSAGELGLSPTGEISLRAVGYTTCPIGNEDWFLRAAAIDIDQRRQLGTGRDVRVELKGVPILYLPWISFPVGSARKSGLLFPTFGTSEKSGFEVGVPYYFNLAPQRDLTLTPRLLTRRGPGIDSRFRYLTPGSSGHLELQLLPHDQVAGRERGLGRVWHRTDFGPALRLELDAAHASDGRWFEDFGLGPDGTSVIYLERRLGLAWLGDNWRLDGRLQHFQTIERSIDDEDRPYARLPQLLFAGTWPLAGGTVATGLDGELAWFERETGVTGLRLDLAPRLAWPLRGPGYHLEPSASWRYTAWDLHDAGPGIDTSPQRSAPVLALDAGLVFERSSRRKRLQQTLEPRLRYIWIPYRDQDELPLFDSGIPDLGLLQLFRTNRYVGADRLGDANELAVGLTTRFIDTRSGARFLSATVGQRFFFERPRVVLPGERPETRHASNLIGELEAGPWRNWSLRLAMEWDAQASNTVRGQAGIQYRPRPDAVVNVGYRYREGLLEQWEASLAWRLKQRWQVFARQVYSLSAGNTIDQLAGLEYGSCCWRIRLMGRRYLSNRTGQQDTAILLQLELKGLSSVGSADDTFLRRSIRGYSPGSAAPPP
jgi:LPS-assembly protein